MCLFIRYAVKDVFSRSHLAEYALTSCLISSKEVKLATNLSHSSLAAQAEARTSHCACVGVTWERTVRIAQSNRAYVHESWHTGTRVMTRETHIHMCDTSILRVECHTCE